MIKDKKKKGTYKVEIMCDNCNKFQNYEIEKGMTREEFVENKVCNLCDCKMR